MPDYQILEIAGFSRDNVIALINRLKKENRIPADKPNDEIIDEAARAVGTKQVTWSQIAIAIEGTLSAGYTDQQKDIFESATGMDVDAITASSEEIFKDQARTIWTSFIDNIQTAGKEFWEWFNGNVIGASPKGLAKLMDGMIAKNLIDEESKSAIMGMLKDFPKGSWWISIVLILSLFKTFIAVFSSAAGGTLMKRLNTEHTPNAPSPEAIIRAAFLHPDLQDRVRKAMAENGYSKEDQDLMFAANYYTFDLDTVRQLRLRGFIDDSTMNQYLDDIGMTPERRVNFLKLFDILPPIQDIATMMGKEAFEPESVAAMGLDRELPGEFVQFAAQQGLSRFWAEKYWIAHWQQPGLEMMFDAYHRRLVDKDFLHTFMKTVEIPPYLRDTLTELAYQPLTRVDIRRMYEDGVLDIDQVYSAYLDHGYSPENATLMTEWTIRYAEPAEKDLSRTQITSLYIDGQLNRPDALTMLQRIGYPEHRAELLLTYAEYEQVKDLNDARQDNIEDMFKNGWISQGEVRTELAKLGLSSERISLLIEKWNIARTATRKLPSKTDLDKFYRNDIITQDQYISEMERLGYSRFYVGLYVKLIAQGKE